MYRDFNVYFIFGVFLMILVLNFPFSYENNEFLFSLFSRNNPLASQTENFSIQDYQIRNYYKKAQSEIKREKYYNALFFLNKISDKGITQINVEQLKAKALFLLALKESDNGSKKLITNKNYVRSVEILKDCLEKFPGNFSSSKILSESYYIAKDYPKLNEVVHTSCLNPNVNFENCKSIAKILIKSGMINDAANICQSIKNDQKKSTYCSWVYKNLGNIYLSEGNEKKAINYFQDAYKINSSSENLKYVIKSRLSRNI